MKHIPSWTDKYGILGEKGKDYYKYRSIIKLLQSTIAPYAYKGENFGPLYNMLFANKFNYVKEKVELYNAYEIISKKYEKNYYDNEYMDIVNVFGKSNNIIIGGLIRIPDFFEKQQKAIFLLGDIFTVYSMDPQKVKDLYNKYIQTAREQYKKGFAFEDEFSPRKLFPIAKIKNFFNTIDETANLFKIALQEYDNFIKNSKNNTIGSQLFLNNIPVLIGSQMNKEVLNEEYTLNEVLGGEKHLMFGFANGNNIFKNKPINENVTFDEFVSKDFIQYINKKYAPHIGNKNLDIFLHTISNIQKYLLQNKENFKDKNITLMDDETLEIVKKIMLGKKFPDLDKLRDLEEFSPYQRFND